MVGPEMAIAAALRLPRNGQRKGVTAMADRAGALAAIGVDAANAFVGPGRGIQFPISDHLDHAAMTLPATVNRGLRALDGVAQHIVQRAENLARLCVMAFFEFFRLLRMTRPAHFGRHYDRDPRAEVLEGVGPVLGRLVALIAANAADGVLALRPSLHGQRDGLVLVALYAGLALAGNRCRQFRDRCGRGRCNLRPCRRSEREYAKK